MLYTAKGTAALLVPLGSLLREATGDWLAVLYAAAAVNLIAAAMAPFVLQAAAAAHSCDGPCRCGRRSGLPTRCAPPNANGIVQRGSWRLPLRPSGDRRA